MCGQRAVGAGKVQQNVGKSLKRRDFSGMARVWFTYG
jgi:hypothetical protein